MVALISVNDEVCGRIDHINVVGVDIDALETDDKDVVGGSWTVHHVQVSIGDIKLMGPFDNVVVC